MGHVMLGCRIGGTMAHGAPTEILDCDGPQRRTPVARGALDVEYFIPFAELEAFYDEPGEYGWIMDAHKHGFARISLIVTDTAPRGGPPLHTHTCEEAVVVPP